MSEKEAKKQAAYRQGYDCAIRGFSSSQFDASINRMSKDEKAAFDRGMYDGVMEKNRKAREAKQ